MVYGKVMIRIVLAPNALAIPKSRLIVVGSQLDHISDHPAFAG
jgi:hypothetical protein